MRKRMWVTLALVLALAGPGLPARAERSNTTPTGWGYYVGADTATVGNYVSANNMRIIDIEVANVSPLRLDVSMVHNSGPHAKAWTWYYGLTFTQLTSLPQIRDGSHRVLDVEQYQLSTGEARFAVVTIANTGADASAWWWYFNVTPSTIAANLSGKRLIDIDAIGGRGGSYNVVMVDNTGSKAQAWWWLYNASSSDVSTLVSRNNARLIDIEPNLDGTFNVIAVPNTGQYWWWYYGLTAPGVLDVVNQHGARIADIERYDTSVGTRFAVILLNNVDELTTRLRETLVPVSGKNGAFGFYAKEVGGGSWVKLNEKKKFEPASTIKVLHHLHAMRAVKAQPSLLTEKVDWQARSTDPARYPGDWDYADDKNKCAYDDPGTPEDYSDELGEVILRQMMEQSDNRTTDAVVNRFGGLAALNNTAWNVVGMSDSQMNHRIGCSAPGDPNVLTLFDAGKLYEGVANGTLLGTGTERAKFYDYMVNNKDGFLSVIQEEAAKQGKSAIVNDFYALVQLAAKGGSYDHIIDCPSGVSGECRRLRRTGFGRVALPFKAHTVTRLPVSTRVIPVLQTVQMRDFLYGSFVDADFQCGFDQCMGESSDISAARGVVHREMLRPKIAAALATW